MPVLIDTSVWIEFYHPKGDTDVKRQAAEAIAGDEVATVAPVVAELLLGARRSPERETIERDLRLFRLIPLGWDEAAVAAALGRSLERSGRHTPMLDLLIAAAAHRGGCELWHTGDEHYIAIAKVSGWRVRNLKPAA
ncbi:MAG TPA: PIN domain-containing protein [bacterium]|nr:PIN domain-containing protein [bacterium]